MEEIIHHLAIFVSGLWQIHVFGEGNTRTTAVCFKGKVNALGENAINSVSLLRSFIQTSKGVGSIT